MFLSFFIALILTFLSYIAVRYEKIILRENKRDLKSGVTKNELTTTDVKRMAFIFALFAVLFLRLSMLTAII